MQHEMMGKVKGEMFEYNVYVVEGDTSYFFWI